MGSPLPGEPHEQPGWETGREKGVPVTPEGSSALELCFLPSPPSVRGWKPPPPSALHAGAEINEITFNYSHYFPRECWSERQHLAVSYSRALPFLLPLKPLPGAPGSCLQPLDTHGAAAPSRQDERRGQEGKDPDRAKGEGRAGGSRGQGWGLAGVRAHSQAGLTCPFPDHLQLEEPSERGERGSAGGWGGSHTFTAHRRSAGGVRPRGTSTTLHSLFVHPGRCWTMDPCPSTTGKMGGTHSQAGGAA